VRGNLAIWKKKSPSVSLRECSPVVPHVQTTEVLACQQNCSAACETRAYDTGRVKGCRSASPHYSLRFVAKSRSRQARQAHGAAREGGILETVC
jgi:hypothetical protein